MGVGIVGDHRSGKASLYCTTSEWAFGPVMQSADEAEAFLDRLREIGLGDPRNYLDYQLVRAYQWFCAERELVEDLANHHPKPTEVKTQ